MNSRLLSIAFVAGVGMLGMNGAFAIAVVSGPTLNIEWAVSDSPGHTQQFSLSPTGNGSYHITLDNYDLCLSYENGSCTQEIGEIESLQVDLDSDPYINLSVTVQTNHEVTFIFSTSSPLILPDGAYDMLLQGNIEGDNFHPAVVLDTPLGDPTFFGGIVKASQANTWRTNDSVAAYNVCPDCTYAGATFESVIGFTGSGSISGQSTFRVTPASSPIPEPATLALLGLGLAGLGVARRRKIT